MEQFVTIRAIQFWRVDLALFQFDYDLTFSVMFMNADKTIYGRFGSRDNFKEAERHITPEGLGEAMKGALEIHAGYPKNKRALSGKKGPKPLWRTTESIPENRGKPNMKPADGSRGGCVHCHQAHDGELWTLRNARKKLEDRLLFPHPMPYIVGLNLDPAERATVTAVIPKSPADTSGFKAGDKIVTFNGQPIISIADVQWVLHHSKETARIRAEVDRGGSKKSLTLKLPKGWRYATDFTWREWTWSIRHRLLGTKPLTVLSDAERKKLSIPAGGMAMRVEGFPPTWVKKANKSAARIFKSGDVIINVDGRTHLDTRAKLLSYLMQMKPSGSTAIFTVLRSGLKRRVGLKIP